MAFNSKEQSRHRLIWPACAAVVTFVALPAPAHAAPACDQWGFPGEISFTQSNEWHLWFTSTGTTARGEANAGHFSEKMHGTVSGRIDGYAVDFEVHWDSGSVGKYEGSVDANGFAHGTTYDAKYPTSSAAWDSDKPFVCVLAPPPPPSAQNNTPPGMEVPRMIDLLPPGAN